MPDTTGTTIEVDPDELIDGAYRTFAEFSAAEGETILRKHDAWKPPNDCESMTVPEMLLHIYRHRPGHAVAPNGHTTPFLSNEEWTRIAKWVQSRMKETGDAR